jgi:hypothetical protein
LPRTKPVRSNCRNQPLEGAAGNLVALALQMAGLGILLDLVECGLRRWRGLPYG